MRVKSALFVDFDNVYTGLQRQDPAAAEEFASRPDRWLIWLESVLPLSHVDSDADSRQVLVRRCYLNPRAFQRFRPYFIRSAFEVIDCPPLTRQGKTSADIRMVMDILDTLAHSTRFDEFIVFSADADFTHVLLRLRQHDRRSVILPVGPSASAYGSACDYMIDDDRFMEEALRVAPEVFDAPAAPAPATTVDEQDRLLARIAECVRETVRESPTPVVMARLAQRISSEFRESGVGNNWLGKGSFKDLLETLQLGHLQISPVIPGYVYDPNFHEPPADTERGDELAQRAPQLAALARKIHRLTDTPYLLPEQFATLLEATAQEVAENGYFLTATSKAVRDRCVDRGFPVARKHVGFLLKGITYSGRALNDSEPEPRELGEVLVGNTIRLCEMAQFDLSDEEKRYVREWILGSLPMDDSPAASPDSGLDSGDRPAPSRALVTAARP